MVKERETQERGEQRQVEEPPTLSSCLSRVSARPALLNCWDKTRSAGCGRCDHGCQQLQPDTRQSKVQTCQAQLHSRASFRAPEPQPHVGGYPSPILQSATSQLSGQSSELPGDRVHSWCMTSGIRLEPAGSGQSEIQFFCISSAPEAPTLSYSLMPVLSRRPLNTARLQ